jgi:hypothetical protein
MHSRRWKCDKVEVEDLEDIVELGDERAEKASSINEEKDAVDLRKPLIMCVCAHMKAGEVNSIRG